MQALAEQLGRVSAARSVPTIARLGLREPGREPLLPAVRAVRLRKHSPFAPIVPRLARLADSGSRDAAALPRDAVQA